MTVGIAGWGGYVPRLRLQRKAIVAANAWSNPALTAYGAGERAMANWDEDSLTMAVAAARDGLTGMDRTRIEAVIFASTTFPFDDRQNAAVLATALNLRPEVATVDVGGSQRAGASALLQALRVAQGGSGPQLVVAAEHRRSRAASPQELLWGDGAAALVVGGDNLVAELIGAASIADDFVDHYRGADSEFDYAWEERWVRDEGFLKIVPKAIAPALAAAGIDGRAVDHFALPCVFSAVAKQLAAELGIRTDAIRDNLHGVCGDTGAAHPLVLLARALECAKPGDLILLAAFGQGADALVFRVTERIRQLAPRQGIGGTLARRREETNYGRFLAFNRLVTQEKGIRAEGDRQTALSTLYRNKAMLTGFLGGRCRTCGTLQFPKSGVCVNPNCHAIDSQDDHPFSDIPARILSWSADWLTYAVDPPAHYGMVQFEEGGRLMADFTDVDPDRIDVGMTMRMVFRIKDFDEQRGFRKYFWKAAPA